MSGLALDVNDIAEQAALFALAVDSDRVDPDETNGHQGLATILAEEAEAFYKHYKARADEHWGGDTGLMWDSIDWYHTSDKWFEEKIVPRIYTD